MKQYAKSPLGYAQMACDTMLNRYPNVNMLPPQSYQCATFNYHQGVFLTGMSRVYELCHDERYLQYMIQWAHDVQDTDGFPKQYNEWIGLTSLDFHQPGNVLTYLYERTKDPHYLKTVVTLCEDLLNTYPKNSYGGFWHFHSMPDQMWLDGLYMAGPLLTHCSVLSGRTEFRELAIRQIFIMYEHMRDPISGLLRHGWDPSKQAPWADCVTGLSQETWGRACGWFVLAIADMLDDIPEDHKDRPAIIEIQKEILSRIMNCQNREGRWFEVIDKSEEQGNWPENSCSCLFIYAIAKGIRKGYIDASMYANIRRAYDRIIETLLPAPDGVFSLGDICVGTSIESGSYEHYINRPRTENDLHGIGAFLLMASEMEKAEKD